jgi:trk system potassium uptake protein
VSDVGVARRLVGHPTRVVSLGFGGAILVGTLLLMLPVSRAGEGGAPPLTALFHSTSAVCVTGLATVDTGTYWSSFGQVVLLGLIQVGGFGIMTLASLLALLVARRLGLGTLLNASAESRSLGNGDVRQVLIGVARVTLAIEAVLALVLMLRFWLGYGMGAGEALWQGVFHSISAFNNAGFGLRPDSLVRYVDDPLVCLPVALAVILGGIGFPVILELRRHLAPRTWSLHTKLTVTMSLLLLVSGTVLTLLGEWSNPGTLGPMGMGQKLHAAFFHSVVARTAGFNSVDISAMNEGTWLVTDILMFIGGGSAGTAGGIKVTTFAVLFFVLLAEVRGNEDSQAFRRRIQVGAQRQALTVALLGVGAIVSGTLLLMAISPVPMAPALFEVVSAFATVGLSTGITAGLPDAGQLLLVALMFLGRIGPVTLVSALAIRTGMQQYRLAEDRPLIG